jgi:general secretion pathway protein G
MNAKRSAFTLVEILIVVVIMAVLAATIIPQFNSSTKDAQTATAVFNLQSLRSQIELYKAQHNGVAPEKLADLTFRSNTSRTTGAVTASPATYPFGPYMHAMPENPFNNLATETAITATPTSATGASGWLYNKATGQVYIDDATLYTE